MSTDPVPTTTFQPEQLGRYQLLQKLGEGGMGEVYLAQDTKLDRRVAIKVLPAQSVNDPDAVARFHREAKALAKLSHSGIVQAHDADEHGGRHFLVMEYVEGTGVADVLKEKGRIPPALAADYIHQAALALQHAHEKGLVHRDLKPSNLLLTPQRQIKILDLGLARFLQDQIGDPSRTQEGIGMGTPDYAAPEQFRDAHSVDHRADIYALGCTLYHLLTGQVPFPGSSLSEKYAAHQHKEPAPLEELCPEMPGGLALIVQRMMAKRPADRFQSAREVADALTPHIASSSPSFARIKSTSKWHAGQLTMTEFKTRSRVVPWAIAAAATVAVMLVGVFAGWKFLGKGESPSQPDQVATTDDQKEKAENPPIQKQDDVGKPKPPVAETDPNVLTVSRKPEDRGRFRTIGEALAQVDHAGMTIRVLDSATYSEAVPINNSEQHAGLTLEATGGATLAMPPDKLLAVLIQKVPRVTVRGFRLHTAGKLGENVFLVAVIGACPGVVLENLDCAASSQPNTVAVDIEGRGAFPASEDHTPIVIQNSRFTTLEGAIRLQNARDVVVRNNEITSCSHGVWMQGRTNDVHIVGNRIWNWDQSGIGLTRLSQESGKILIANNSLLGLRAALRIENPVAGLQAIEVRNNLLLAESGPDIALEDKDQQVLAGWRIENNWRQVRPPKAKDPEAKKWVLSVKDKMTDAIAVQSRNPAEPNFLRPAKDSPLGTGGAGNEDPSLPTYVGAVPPEGVEPWDWDRTWRMLRPGVLLTVSKDPKDGGKFRTINDALKTAKPWATIRVLDDATYAEAVVIDDPAKHKGIVLEALKHATIALTAQSRRALLIQNTPQVRVRGFRFREAPASREGFAPFVSVSAHTPGVVLEELNMEATGRKDGIVIRDASILPGELPLVVRRCNISGGKDAILVFGSPEIESQLPPTANILIHDNRVTGANRGIQLQGRLAHCQVTGNVVGNCHSFGLQIEDLIPGSDQILLANNTVFSTLCCVSFWDNEPHKKYQQRQVEVRNNLVSDAGHADMMFILGKAGVPSRAGDADSLIKLWRFGQNWRDRSGTSHMVIFPLAPGDKKLLKSDLPSVDPAHPDFLRPAADSPLAKEGAGKDDPSLPTYVGAVPPKGVAPWDWNKTWKARTPKTVKEAPTTSQRKNKPD